MRGLPASEEAILARIDAHFTNVPKSLELGRGDDCAILTASGQHCVSSDLFLEDTHFRTTYFEPEEIGYKALAVNLSDLAAMGAKPLAFTLCLGLPDNITMAWLDRFLAGMANLSEAACIALAGGDISASSKIHISITVIGDRLENGALLRRGGCMAGDPIFLVGDIGLSRIGLYELEKQGRAAIEEWPSACKAHLRPAPQNRAALIIARNAHNGRPPVLMDVSDGLARDLPRLLGRNATSGPGACVELPDSLLHTEVLHHAWRTGLDPGLSAFQGGEDYALLGACEPGLAGILQAAIPDFHLIGHVTSAGPIHCNGIDVTELKGFDHFERGE